MGQKRRKGLGRPKGPETVQIRVPRELLPQIKRWISDTQTIGAEIREMARKSAASAHDSGSSCTGAETQKVNGAEIKPSDGAETPKAKPPFDWATVELHPTLTIQRMIGGVKYRVPDTAQDTPYAITSAYYEATFDRLRDDPEYAAAHRVH